MGGVRNIKAVLPQPEGIAQFRLTVRLPFSSPLINLMGTKGHAIGVPTWLGGQGIKAKPVQIRRCPATVTEGSPLFGSQADRPYFAPP